MNSRSRPVRPVTVAVVGSVAATASPAPPTLELPIVRWEYKLLYEKDEDFEIVFRNGKPVIGDEWVVLYFLAPDGSEIEAQFDKAPFDRFIFPMLFEASISYWLALTPADPLYERRDDILENLMELKQRFRL